MPNYNGSPRRIGDNDTVAYGAVQANPETGEVKIGDGDTEWSLLAAIGGTELSLWFGVGELTSVSGATAGTVASLLASLNLADAATQSVGITVPRSELRGWATVNVSVVWAPSTAVAGNVRFQVASTGVNAGAVPAGVTAAVTVASPAVIDQLTVSALGTVTVPTGSYVGLRVDRLGADALDTTTAAAKVVGVLVTKAA